MFDGTLTLELDYPITEEQLDAILDIDMEHTVSVTFHTKHGKEVEFEKRKKGEWVLYGNDDDCGFTYWCSECNQQIPEDYFYSEYEHGKWIPNEMWNYCPNCGADMRGEE